MDEWMNKHSRWTAWKHNIFAYTVRWQRYNKVNQTTTERNSSSSSSSSSNISSSSMPHGLTPWIFDINYSIVCDSREAIQPCFLPSHCQLMSRVSAGESDELCGSAWIRPCSEHTWAPAAERQTNMKQPSLNKLIQQDGSPVQLSTSSWSYQQFSRWIMVYPDFFCQMF